MSRFHPLHVIEIRRETPDSVSIRFDVPEALKPAFAFEPGQYLTLRTTIEGEDIRRSYSISSGVNENSLRVGVRRVEGGAFSTYANESLKPGDLLEVMPPEGRFTPRSVGARHVLCIAAGSGITPVLSIAKSLLACNEVVSVTLVYGNRTTSSVMFAEEIEDLKNRYLGRFVVIHILSREAQDVTLLSGRITVERLSELGNGIIDFASVNEAFLCGPEGMIAAAKEVLETYGIAADSIRKELFTPSARRRISSLHTPVRKMQDIVAHLFVTLNGRTGAFDMRSGDDNLIDAAARAGIDLPYSCKNGMCCTCRCKVTAGAVEMAVNYSLETWETKAGFVLACQAKPTTANVSLDFDEL